MIEKASDQISDLAVAHLKSYSTARPVVDCFFSWQHQRLEEVKDIPEHLHLEAEVREIHPGSINHYLQALDRAINGERTAAGMEWENVPKAIAPTTHKLYPADTKLHLEVENLENLFDTVLGVSVRRGCYFYLLNNYKLMRSLWCEGVPPIENILFPIVFLQMRSLVR